LLHRRFAHFFRPFRAFLSHAPLFLLPTCASWAVRYLTLLLFVRISTTVSFVFCIFNPPFKPSYSFFIATSRCWRAHHKRDTVARCCQRPKVSLPSVGRQFGAEQSTPARSRRKISLPCVSADQTGRARRPARSKVVSKSDARCCGSVRCDVGVG